MWTVVRLVAVAVLVVVGLLLFGGGPWLVEGLAASLRTVGLDAGRSAPAPELGTLVVAGGLAVGAAAAVVRPLARVVGQLVTLLHELGHTVVAAACGARPAGIVLRHDASGHATARWVGRATVGRRLALAAVAFAGAPTAAVTSAAAAQLLVLLGPEAVLWSAAAAGAVVGVLARSAWSLAIAVVFAGSAVAALSDAAEPWAATLVVAALAATALTSARFDLRAARRPIPPGDDARAVRRELGVPPRLVRTMQAAVTVAAAVWTVWLLVPEPAAVTDLLGLPTVDAAAGPSGVVRP